MRLPCPAESMAWPCRNDVVWCRVYMSKAKDNDGEKYGNRSACGDCGASWGQDRDQHAETHSGKTSDSCCHDGRQRIDRAASCHRSAHSITRTSAVSEC